MKNNFEQYRCQELTNEEQSQIYGGDPFMRDLGYAIGWAYGWMADSLETISRGFASTRSGSPGAYIPNL